MSKPSENTSGRSEKELEGVSLLGNQGTKYKYDYDPSVLEKFPNKHRDADYMVTFNCPEFTSLCLTGDALIDTARDENKYPKGIPIRDLVGTEGYLYSFDTKTLKPVVKKYSQVRKTGEKVKVLRIHLTKFKGTGKGGFTEEQTFIDVTPNHPILVKKGWNKVEWIEARNLKENDQLIVSQRTEDSIRDETSYRLVARSLFKEELNNREVHHIDHNHRNNSPENLVILSSEEHKRYHRKEQYKYYSSLDRDKLIKEYNSGANFNSLAKKYNCDFSTIKNFLEGYITPRSQSESLKLKNYSSEREDRKSEVCSLYKKGYSVTELAEYFKVHMTTISKWIKEKLGYVRSSVESKNLRKALDLPSLNHKVTLIEELEEKQDVYNLEVEDTECFFANEVLVHNCPKTGQPDFATLYLNYIPGDWCVESKSLKLYLFSFRNHGDFHEDCVCTIGKDLVKLLQPKFLEVKGNFLPRGGLSIDPYFVYGAQNAFGNFFREMANQRLIQRNLNQVEVRNR